MNNITKKAPQIQDFLQKPTQKKLRNEFLADCHDLNDNYKKAVKARNCGSFIEMREYLDHSELHNANFCKGRLCPMCNWRLSQKRFSNLSAVTELAKSNKYQLLFLTLTSKNVIGENLKAEIKNIFTAWRNLSDKNPNFKKSIHGWFRALEVTYNQDTDTYHPHLHVILAVKSTYSKPGYYINQQSWSELWQRYLKIDYLPIVHIQKAYTKKNQKSAEIEASKYTVKDTDYLIENNIKLSAQVVKILDSALRAVRIIAYGGILKRYYQDLQLQEENLTDDLDNITEELAYIIKKYRWNFGLSKYLEF
jgi:plasmid rolling circle replication initiator protein Rep